MPDDELSPVHRHNRAAWDRMVRRRQRFARPATDEDLETPLATVDGPGWLEEGVRGANVLCLAAGGGRQSALYAAAGARVTVVDLSPAMLELDRQVAVERRLEIRAIECSMDRLIGLRDAEFDLVIHPVSTCYAPEIGAVYREVARVVRDSGIYISQHKQPTSLQASLEPGANGHYELREPYYRSGPLPRVAGSRLREDGALEFLHRWEQILGEMCRSGFWIEDLIEPLHAREHAAPGDFAHRAMYVAPYVRVKARRRPRAGATPTKPGLWLGD
jgi:SAM-dependent methyltransferase